MAASSFRLLLLMGLATVLGGPGLARETSPTLARRGARTPPLESMPKTDKEADPDALRDLPLRIVPAKGPGADTLAVIITGDGGWTKIDREIARYLADRGVPVVGLLSIRYFLRRRTPEEAAADLERIIHHYGALWRKDRVLLIGYSRGAGVMPFIVNRLAPSTRSRVSLVALLGLGHGISFKINWRDYLGSAFEVNEQPVLPELNKLRGVKVLCIYGQEETDTLRKELDPQATKVVTLPGAHHFGGRYEAVAEVILKELKPGAHPPGK
jgi:type IV secretory pathway VirJ component